MTIIIIITIVGSSYRRVQGVVPRGFTRSDVARALMFKDYQILVFFFLSVPGKTQFCWRWFGNYRKCMIKVILSTFNFTIVVKFENYFSENVNGSTLRFMWKKLPLPRDAHIENRIPSIVNTVDIDLCKSRYDTLYKFRLSARSWCLDLNHLYRTLRCIHYNWVLYLNEGKKETYLVPGVSEKNINRVRRLYEF